MASSSTVLSLRFVPLPRGVGGDVFFQFAVAGGLVDCLPPQVVSCLDPYFVFSLLLGLELALCVARSNVVRVHTVLGLLLVIFPGVLTFSPIPCLVFTEHLVLVEQSPLVL